MIQTLIATLMWALVASLLIFRRKRADRSVTYAAITVAVVTHAEHRRRQAAPETRAFAPGSQLFASRWVAVGRSRTHTPSPRR